MLGVTLQDKRVYAWFHNIIKYTTAGKRESKDTVGWQSLNLCAYISINLVILTISHYSF